MKARAIHICMLAGVVITGCESSGQDVFLQERVSELEEENRRLREQKRSPETSGVTNPPKPKPPRPLPTPQRPDAGRMTNSMARMLATKFIPEGNERDVGKVQSIIEAIAKGRSPEGTTLSPVTRHKIEESAQRIFYMQLALTSGPVVEGACYGHKSWNGREDAPSDRFHLWKYKLVQSEFTTRLDKRMGYYHFIKKRAPHTSFMLRDLRSVTFEGVVEESKERWSTAVSSGVSSFTKVGVEFADGLAESVYIDTRLGWKGVELWEGNRFTNYGATIIRKYWVYDVGDIRE